MSAVIRTTPAPILQEFILPALQNAENAESKLDPEYPR